MKTYRLYVGTGLAAGFVLAAAVPVHATAYNFTLIAQTGGDYYTLTAGTINDAGTVAYAAALSNASPWYSQAQLLTTTMSGTTQVIADTSGSIKSFFRSDSWSSSPQINNSGAVAVDVFYDDDEQGVVLFQNGVSTTVADTYGELTQVGGRRLNDSGWVAYQAVSQGSSTSDLYSWDGSVSTKVAGPNARSIGFNDLGELGYDVSTGSNAFSLYFGLPGSATLVAQTGSQFALFGFGDVNNDGTVVFTASLTGGGEGFYSWKDGILTLIADSSDGFSYYGPPAINDEGHMVYSAGYYGGQNCILDGTDPLANRVISSGDELFGSTFDYGGVTNLNASGQFVFWAQLADGREVLVRADPIPEPATLYLFSLFLAFASRSTRRH